MTESSLLDACRTLFGDDINLNRDFLFYLQPSGVKVAYRAQAKLNHPDLFNDSPHQVRLQQTERFRQIHDAYHLIKGFLDQRHRRDFFPHKPQPTRQPAPRRPAARSTARDASETHRHSRPVPTIPLEFGMFCYYLGRISYKDLIEALIWQRRQRPMMGAIAVRWGWLTDRQVTQVGKHRGGSLRFGRKSIELGLLSQLQVDALVRHQRTLQQKIGQYFIDKGLITEQEADQLASQLQNHNRQVLARNRRPRPATF